MSWMYKESLVVQNRDLETRIPASLFDRLKPPSTDHDVVVPGRGAVHTFRRDGRELILKQYRRGGMLSRLVKETYLFLGFGCTRMWQEFHLLARMQKMGLPVPTPVAACCKRTSLLTYSGYLVSEKVPDSFTLAEFIKEQPLTDRTWSKVGRVIARFHQHQVDHADLNAHNIMLTPAGDVFLIDFDKSRIRPKLGDDRARANLDRLRRSLNKLRRKIPEFHFSEENWLALKQGYRDQAGQLESSILARSALPWMMAAALSESVLPFISML